jgi:hypothetical protein
MNNQKTIAPISATSLLSDAFRIFEKKFWPLTTVSFIGSLSSVAVSMVVASAIALSSYIPEFYAPIFWFIVLPAAIVLSLACFVFQIWSSAALLAIANEIQPIKIKHAYRQTISKIFAYAWVGFLTITIVIAGSAALIIPGLVAAVWFCLAPIFAVIENKRGADALAASRSLLKNYWRLSLKFLSLAFVIIILATFAASLFGLTPPFQSLLANTLANGFYACALLALYKKLAGIKGNAFPPAAKNKARFYLAAAMGTIVALVLITSGIVLALKYKNDAMRFYDSQILQQALMEYKQKQGAYPNSLNDLTPDFLPTTPADPLTGNPYPYAPVNDKKDFSLTVNYDHFQTQTLSSQTNNLPSNK